MQIANLFLGAAALSLLAATPLQAGTRIDTQRSLDRVRADVTVDDMVVLRTEVPFAEVRVANPEVADVVIMTDQSFQVLGKGGGKTNVMLYDGDRQLVDVIDVRVGFDLAELKRALYETLPGEDVQVRPMAGGVYLSGEVSSPLAMTRAERIAQAYAPDRVTNGLAVRDSHQVMLEVRFVEASRDAVRALGIGLLTERGLTDGVLNAGDFSLGTNTSAVGGAAVQSLLGGGIGAATLDAQIEALETKGTIRTLAEPNLISMSGETASFLAGGEFPIPIPLEEGRIGIEYRKFGVGLAFTPTVLPDGVINLKVAPEVSQLDPINTVRIGGVEVPGLRVRRANTTVELRNDQSFAIAGLLQADTSNSRTQVPWLGSVPVLGALFSSTRYQKAETELVIIVTPRLAQPVSDISALRTPLDDSRSPSDAEAFLLGRVDALPEGFSYAGE
jgi:pilus assembly protein CpaC